MKSRWACVVAIAVVCIVYHPKVSGFGVEVHGLITRYALAERRTWMKARVSAAPRGAADTFRQWLYEQAGNPNGGETSERFRRRYPNIEAFDRWGFKEFMSVDPRREIWGVDRFHDISVRRGDLLEEAAKHPDLDERDRERVAHGARRNALLDAAGLPFPQDPATITGWVRTGLGSQSSAHYALPNIERSDEEDVLKEEPHRFGYPKEVQSFCHQRAQAWTDLSILAALWRGEGSEYLSLLYAGHAHHYLQDAASPYHNLQVGLYEFFVDAKKQAIGENVRTVGGLLGSRQGFINIGINIISNHHLFGEHLWATQLLAEHRIREAGGQPKVATIAAGLDVLSDGDPEIVLGTTDDRFAKELVEKLAMIGAVEGSQLYQAVHELAVRDIHRGSFVYRDESNPGGADEPESFVTKEDRGVDAMESYIRLNTAAMGRAGTAMRVWFEGYDRWTELPQKEVDPESLRRMGPRARAAAIEESLLSYSQVRDAKVTAAVQRLVKDRLDELEMAEERRAAWMPMFEKEEEISWRYLLAAIGIGVLALVILAAGSLRSSQRRRPRVEVRF